RIRGYTSPHRDLFAYLSMRVGESVPAAMLRVLTGDAVHTERRARELRDLGLDVEAARSGGADAYVLRSVQPSLDEGSWNIVRLNIQGDRTLSVPDRDELIAAIGASPRE